ncbi:MAG: ABC transporter ATP-binding protein [Longimicrobiales bacterium]
MTSEVGASGVTGVSGNDTGNAAIEAVGIGKRYQITWAVRPVYDRLGETLVTALTRLLGRRSAAAGDGHVLWALKDVHFEIKSGEVVGLIGRNGAGKSTLLKVLSRITEPTEGHALLRGRVGSLLEVGTGFHPDLTGVENIFMNGAILGMPRREVRRKLEQILEFAEIARFADTPVKFYSSGMYVRLAFSVAAHNEPDVLLVDEVLAVGDAAFQQKCIGKMGEVAAHGRTVVFVSHSMAAITRLCGRGMVLEAGRVHYDGDVHAAVRQYNDLVFGGDQSGGGRLPHVLFEEGAPDHQDFAITRLELLSAEGAPQAIVHTWDDVMLRVHFRARQHVRRGAVHIELRTAEGARVVELSTQPDANVPLAITPGEHFVDLRIRRLPLAAGDYLLSAGLSIPKVEWLWQMPDLAGLTVHPRDIYDSGLPPALPRSALAIEHEWRI